MVVLLMRSCLFAILIWSCYTCLCIRVLKVRESVFRRIVVYSRLCKNRSRLMKSYENSKSRSQEQQQAVIEQPYTPTLPELEQGK